MILSFRLQVQEGSTSTKSGTNLFWFGWILIRTPFDTAHLILRDERLVHCVTLMVGYSDEAILRAGNEITLLVPVTNCDFFTVFGDAWNLSVCLAVEKDNRAFL